MFNFQEMTQDACLTLKTLEAALSTMRPACVKVSKKLIITTCVHLQMNVLLKECVDMYVLSIIAADGGSADGGGKGEAFRFLCINPHMFSFSFSVFTHSHTQITRALSSLKHRLTCPASLGESSWCWCCKLGLFLPCGSSKRKTAPMKLCEQYAFIKFNI